jgi:hypothetical protein
MINGVKVEKEEVDNALQVLQERREKEHAEEVSKSRV